MSYPKEKIRQGNSMLAAVILTVFTLVGNIILLIKIVVDYKLQSESILLSITIFTLFMVLMLLLSVMKLYNIEMTYINNNKDKIDGKEQVTG